LANLQEKSVVTGSLCLVYSTQHTDRMDTAEYSSILAFFQWQL